jgi:hypothetical protein
MNQQQEVLDGPNTAPSPVFQTYNGKTLRGGMLDLSHITNTTRAQKLAKALLGPNGRVWVRELGPNSFALEVGVDPPRQVVATAGTWREVFGKILMDYKEPLSKEVFVALRLRLI